LEDRRSLKSIEVLLYLQRRNWVIDVQGDPRKEILMIRTFSRSWMLVVVEALLLVFAASGAGQEYSLESVWPVAGLPGGIEVLEEDVFVVSLTDVGAIQKWEHGESKITVSVWENASERVPIVGGLATGPRGVSMDPFGNLLSISNDQNHNLLAWDSCLRPVGKRLETSQNTGLDGRIYAVDNDQNGNVFILFYYGIPKEHNPLEVYPCVSKWVGSTGTRALSSSQLKKAKAREGCQETESDAHEGMCVNRSGSVLWYTDRQRRFVHRMIESPEAGYTEDECFSLEIGEEYSWPGLRGIAITPDEARIAVCACKDGSRSVKDRSTGKVALVPQRASAVILADATSGKLIGSVDLQGSQPFDIDFDEKGNFYVTCQDKVNETIINKVQKYAYVPPTPTETATLTPTGTLLPTHTATPVPGLELPQGTTEIAVPKKVRNLLEPHDLWKVYEVREVLIDKNNEPDFLIRFRTKTVVTPEMGSFEPCRDAVVLRAQTEAPLLAFISIEDHSTNHRLEVADFDGDGVMELVRFLYIGASVFKLADHHFTKKIPQDDVEERYFMLSIQDIDEDGRPELVVKVMNKAVKYLKYESGKFRVRTISRQPGQ